MAAHADAVGGGGGGRHHKFFKILMPGSFELSLSIPAKFVEGLGDCRPCRARLRHRIRTGRGRPSTSWDVDLVRHDDGRLSLTGRGWLDFVSANAISAGHLLVFEHLNSHGAGGSSLLDLAVDLFDASGCLISSDADIVGGLQQQREKYSSSSNNGGCHDDDKQDGGGTAAAKKALVDEENKSAANNNRRRRRCEPEEEEEEEAAIIPCTGGVVLNKRRKVTGSITTTSTIGGSLSNGGQQQQQQDEDETLCRRIERPYQLRFLDLSKSFCDRVGWSSSRDVVLCAAGDMSNNNRWQVSVKVTAKSGGMMCTGWAEFATDNGLAISDACVFIPPPQPSSSSEHHHHDVLQVHVLRGGRGSY
ncbi:hypothetical protein BS78_08G171900 [Paspalum vaginatum]|nr:hypothetical protein BS78_08G171900 [Paspalum vaginatum]